MGTKRLLESVFLDVNVAVRLPQSVHRIIVLGAPAFHVRTEHFNQVLPHGWIMKKSVNVLSDPIVELLCHLHPPSILTHVHDLDEEFGFVVQECLVLLLYFRIRSKQELEALVLLEVIGAFHRIADDGRLEEVLLPKGPACRLGAVLRVVLVLVVLEEVSLGEVGVDPDEVASLDLPGGRDLGVIDLGSQYLVEGAQLESQLAVEANDEVPSYVQKHVVAFVDPVGEVASLVESLHRLSRDL